MIPVSFRDDVVKLNPTRMSIALAAAAGDPLAWARLMLGDDALEAHGIRSKADAAELAEAAILAFDTTSATIAAALPTLNRPQRRALARRSRPLPAR